MEKTTYLTIKIIESEGQQKLSVEGDMAPFTALGVLRFLEKEHWLKILNYKAAVKKESNEQ